MNKMSLPLVAFDIAGSGIVGCASAALFTTIHPAVGALFGVTAAVVGDITKLALDRFAKNLDSNLRTSIARGAGIGVAVSVVTLGVGISPLGVLALGISQIAFLLLFAFVILGGISCCKISFPKTFDKLTSKVNGKVSVPLQN